MSEKRRYNFKSILINTVWVILGVGTVALLLAAMNKKNTSGCKGVQINIHGVKNNLFIDKKDVRNMLEKVNFGSLKGKALNTFDLCGMENVLEKNKWIKDAKLYFDNNDVLTITISEREPIARVFVSDGNSFYIDSSICILPLSSKFSARLPAFTNFPTFGTKPSKADSNLLTDVRNISTLLANDSFWMAQIEQVDITPERSFEMIPKIGNQLIVFGTAENYGEKFRNLLLFYKNVQSKVGWNKYSRINVSYKGQVIAVKRGAGEIKMDSLRTIQLMKQLVANAQKLANDSANNIQLAQPEDDQGIPLSQAREDKFSEDPAADNPPALIKQPVKPVTADVKTPKPSAQSPVPGTGKAALKKSPAEVIQPDRVEKQNSLPIKNTVKKPETKKPAANASKQPKAVMQPANDY